MHHFRRQDFEPLCSSGGDYHACASTRFVGCCQANPCVAGGSCNGGDLKPMSFDKNLYSSAFADQECSTGLWYTCSATNPPFVGCCKSNACHATSGCPDGDLVEGSLSSNPYYAAPWLSAATIDATSSAAQASSSSAATTASSGHKLGGGAIAGVVIGVVGVVVLLIAVLLHHLRRRAAETNSRGHEINEAETPPRGIYTDPLAGHAASDIHEAPVTEVGPKGFKSPRYTGNSRLEDQCPSHVVLTRCTDASSPSPTPAYSPYAQQAQHAQQNPHSPPQYFPLNELETSSSKSPTLTLPNGLRQSVELPSPSLPHQHRDSSAASVNSLGISGISHAFKPSPLSSSGPFEPYSSGGPKGPGGPVS